jgi:hypothetical protein
MLFLAGDLLALLIAWMTISLHTARTAGANPIEAIRYE